MNGKIWQWIGDYCSGLLDKSEERELRAWMDEAEENKQLFMEGGENGAGVSNGCSFE